MAQGVHDVAGAGAARRYWLGNAAKAAVLEELLERAAGRSVTVLDLGCGAGGDWPLVLRDHAGLHLIGWDPDQAALARARAALSGLPATVLDDPRQIAVGLDCDFVVSFSVLEHVYDRPAYLELAAAALKPGGLMFLNYDDGHFRTPVDLRDGAGATRSLREEARTRFGRIAVLWRQERYYQRRVTADELTALIAGSPFTLEQDWFHNLDAFKDLAKTVPPERQQAFMDFWLQVESRLNDEFRVAVPEHRGESTNLWSRMASRTLLLRKADEPQRTRSDG